MRLIENIRRLLGLEDYQKRETVVELPKRIYYFGSTKEGEGKVYYFSIQDREQSVHVQRSTKNPKEFYTNQGEIEGANLVRRKTKREPSASAGLR